MFPPVTNSPPWLDTPAVPVADTPPWKVDVPVESTYIGPPVVAEELMRAEPFTASAACGEVEPIPNLVVVAKRKSSDRVLKLSETTPKVKSPSLVEEA